MANGDGEVEVNDTRARVSLWESYWRQTPLLGAAAAVAAICCRIPDAWSWTIQAADQIIVYILPSMRIVWGYKQVLSK